ncbi:MAG: hypothetical protein WC326_05815 [Candidatus Delongbacteria bacterium]
MSNSHLTPACGNATPQPHNPADPTQLADQTRPPEARLEDRYDLDQRPRWYRSDPAQEVRGTLRRALLEDVGVGRLLEEGLDSALAPSLDQREKKLLFDIAGPAALSGEDLPELSDGAVELCRIWFNGTVHNEVTAVYACPASTWEADCIAELAESLGIDPAAIDELDDELEEDDEGEDDEIDESVREEFLEKREWIESQACGKYVIYVVDEVGLHDGDSEPFEVQCSNGPYTLGELIRFLESCDWWGMGCGLVWGAWHSYNEGRVPGEEDFVPLEQAADFIRVESTLYPELAAYYREHLQP